jgi:hypothetical protein
VTLQRARNRAKDSRTRRERLRDALGLTRTPMVVTERRPGGWRTESYGPFGLGAHRDPRWAEPRQHAYRTDRRLG